MVCDNERRIEATTLEKFALLIGNFKVDNCLRWEDSKSSSGELALDVPLTRMWFKERPMNSNDAAVEFDTKAGSKSRLVSYSYIG